MRGHVDMKFITNCEFSVPGLEDHEGIPYYHEIYKSYLGYRQCYSRDLEDGTIREKLLGAVDTEYEKYVGLYAQYLHWLDHRKLNSDDRTPEDYIEIARSTIDQDKEQWVTYLHMCWFIYNHMMHESPLEHIQLQIQFKNMSRACQQQLTRHRLAIFSIQSQRYVKFFKDGNEDDAVLYMPPSITRHPEAMELYKQYLEQLPEVVQQIRALGYADIKEEDLRYLYPNAMTGDGIMSINFRSMMHFLNERCCFHAQYEIRQFARQLRTYLCEHFPFIGSQLGPKCYRLGWCPETKSCGTIKTRIVFQPSVK